MKHQLNYIAFILLTSFASIIFAYDCEANNREVTFADIPNGGNDTNIIASGECGEHATWSLDENGKLTIAGYGDMYNYGRRYDDGLAPWLSSYAKIKSIEISDGITSIGDNTFGISSATEATIDISYINLPNGLKRIGKSAFRMCKSMTSIIIPNSVTVIDDYAFTNLENLTSIKLPNALISIGSGSLSSTGINGIKLPNTLTSIGADAFCFCENLVYISIPSSVINIGEDAFYECNNLKNITNYSEKPQNLSSETFFRVTDATLHVKKGCREAYLNADVWKNFTITEDAEESIDISKIVNTILKRDGANEGTSDVNGDGVVSIADVVYAIDSNKKSIHEYVDLGLSVKWATCNIGAAKPEDYGDYYAWGETEEKSTYDWNTYKWCNGSATTLTKYCTTSKYGIVDNKTNLEIKDDVAHAKWGDSWRMPTLAEIDELKKNCTWTWTTQNGVSGHIVTSLKNGNSIFLPAAGYRNDNSLYQAGIYGDGFYWSSSLYTLNPEPERAYSLVFWSSQVDIGCHSDDRSYGLPVRPVCDDVIHVSSITFDGASFTMKVDELKAINYTVTPSDATNQEIIWSSSDEAVAVVSDGLITAKGEGTCTIRAVAADGSGEYCECTVEVEKTELACEYVDLGLSVRWATCNVGAEKPEDYGDYFAWGEISGYNDGKTTFDWNTYKWCSGQSHMRKYCRYINEGTPDNKTILETEDDVAHEKWGIVWRMPTKAELDELSDPNNCEWTDTSLNGVDGYRVTSLKNGNSIFLPSAGYRSNKTITGAGSKGRYWSSVLSSSNSDCAYSWSFENGSWNLNGIWSDGPMESLSVSRCIGQSIRPVYDNPDNVHAIDFEETSAYMLVGSTKTIGYTIKPLNATNKQLIWYSSDNSVATISDGTVTAKGIGVCAIRATAADGSGVYSECTVEVMEPNCEYVDLGLSVKWATCNIGAKKPEDYGNYFAWGETIGDNNGKTTFDWNTYKWCNGSDRTMTKYCTSSNYGTSDNKTFLEPEDDVVHVKLGGNWRMPTKIELEELLNSNNCTWTWTTRNGIKGYRVTSLKNGNAIFLPAAGSYDSNNLQGIGIYGCYRSSSLGSSLDGSGLSNTAYTLDIDSDDVGGKNLVRYYGLSVRPVYDNAVHVSNISFEELSFDMKVGAKKTINYTITPSDATNKNILWSSSNQAVATVENGIVTAKGEGTCTIRGTAADGSGTYSECTINSKNNCEYVDLGLSVKWATCNIGAENPEDYGNYFAWGETIGYNDGKTYFDWFFYNLSDSTGNVMEKYCTRHGHGVLDFKKTLEPGDDAAQVKWGDNWRMPTKEETEELLSKDNCLWTWTTKNGVKGYRVTSLKNGNSIFLPAAGYRSDDNLTNEGAGGFYWSSSLGGESNLPMDVSAVSISFDQETVERLWVLRYKGLSIRPVWRY